MTTNTPARGILTGTPVPSAEREAASGAPSPLVQYRMNPEDMERYLRERYGDRLAAAARYAADDRPFSLERRRKEDAGVVETAEDLRDQYLALRVAGKARYEALRELGLGPVRGLETLKAWGLDNKDTEAAEIKRLRTEMEAPTEETAATEEPQDEPAKSPVAQPQNEPPQAPVEETRGASETASDKEAKPGRPRIPRPEATRERYLELRLQGKARTRALRELCGSVAGGYEYLEAWGLRDLEVEQAELARLRSEMAARVEPAAAPETTAEAEAAATYKPQPTITVPVPVSGDVVRAVLDALIRDVHATAVAKGWHETIVPLPVHLALIHSEVSEALQADRKGEGDQAVAEELADVVIRAMDTAAAHGLDLAGALLTKMETNKRRPYRHGGRRY
ncbi:MAG: hypothetical protein K6T81_09555 [Alicyclobacillus macrosporangiidus]|uniref:hypothetical protein n=1 Tax=Alicyclobacillus macrosporangiidus TaxID=392015 RepID=UPI0026EB3D98|nr:hypothetical protein [Alicyclobacillus macrosporangiidus]MCL6598976.1 hypothetical protein [Alicyclobacillus macrosporangiidus]